MVKLTPMMAQYMKIKEQYQDCILMYRLGDFYEMFFEDAVEASKILQITLTSRNKKGKGESIPMCGVPFHAVENYIAKLTRVGKKIALCDQVTKPSGKGIVERDVIRVITPGTTFDENILDQKSNNYVVCVMKYTNGYGFAYSDVTTGEFKTTILQDDNELAAELMRIRPAECITKTELIEKLKGLGDMPVFLYEKNEETVEEMMFSYLKETQKTNLEHIQGVQKYERKEFMPLDESCIRNLELFFCNHDGKKNGSLIAVIDQTVSAMGGRMMRKWLMHPLLDMHKIKARLDRVEKFVKDSTLLRQMREQLDQLYDMERLLSRLSLGTGNARDLVAMKQSLLVIPTVKNLIEVDLNPLNHLVDLIEKSIIEEAPAITSGGGMIKKGFNPELDDLLAISGEGKNFIAELQQREIERTGISSLKVKFNKVFGYYLEISKSNLNSVPDDYIRKQTLVNAERFITPELKKYEEKVLTAEDRIKELEYELFYQVRMELVKEIKAIQKNADVLAKLDVISSLAFLAVENDYVKPEIENGRGLKIVNGRHPVVEKMADDFVPNDCLMDKTSDFVLITGPNMGGKSTFLRQVALTVLMSQIGSYVPAESAVIGVVDRIFTRVGASDNLSKGQSTFMVEMTEASYILKNATDRSLVILDELGRGTSTYDGVSIAWAVTEFLHNNVKAKTLFATHYHELVELVDKLDCGINMSVAVRENETEGVVFLYKIVKGGVDKSYGIEVAKLAGLPNDVVSRAQNVLRELETKHVNTNQSAPDQIAMFEREHQEVNSRERKILDQLKEINVNNMTPMEAMKELDRLNQLFL